MDTIQKDPGTFILTEGRHDQAREHQMILPRTMESDVKLVASLEIQLMETLNARGQQEHHQVINYPGMLADGTPYAGYSPDVVLHGGKSIL